GMGSSIAEAVADAAHGEDVFGLARVTLELLAQVTDVDVDRPRLAIVGASPERLEQHPPAVDAAGVRRQRPQELELDVRELHRLVPDLDGSAAQVDPQPVHRDRLLTFGPDITRRRRGTAQERPDAAAELADREGLRDVVVRAELEPEHLV